ncbi:unnamed protein product [Choristocarpus tenellus]
MRTALLTALSVGGLWKRAVEVLRALYGSDDSGVGVVKREGRDMAVDHTEADNRKGEQEEASARAGVWDRTSASRDFRIVMHACVQAGASKKALLLWNELRESNDRLGGDSGWLPSPSAYAAALRACSHVGQLKQALTILKEMKTLGLNPEPQHYALAMGVAVKSADSINYTNAIKNKEGGDGIGVQSDESVVVFGGDNAVSHLVRDMKTAGVDLGPEAYEAMCWGWSVRSQWQQASEGVLTLVQERGFPSSYNAQAVRAMYKRMLSACVSLGVKAGDQETARRIARAVVEDAEARLFEPDLSQTGLGTDLLTAAAFTFSMLGDWEGAHDLVLRGGNDVRVVGPYAFRHAIYVCACAGQLKKAEVLLDLVLGGSAFSAYRTGAGEDDNPDAIIGVETLVTAQNGKVLDREVLLALIRAYEEAGQKQRAEEIRTCLQALVAVELGLEMERLPVVGGKSITDVISSTEAAENERIATPAVTMRHKEGPHSWASGSDYDLFSSEGREEEDL